MTITAPTADKARTRTQAPGRGSASVRSPLETYLRDINQTALLSREEEHDLGVRVVEGDPTARDHMARANLRLVVSIARGYANRGLALPDLIEEGNLGLLRAVEGFDPDMGTRFSTYASYWIKQSIKRALINTSKTIRIPAYMIELLSKWRRANIRLNDVLGRTPTPEETARSLGIPKRKLPIIDKAMQINQATPQGDNPESGWSLSEVVTDQRTAAPDEVMMKDDATNYVMSRLDSMDEREAAILRMRFGLEGHEPMTLKEIGAQLGLTRERVRQIETAALQRLAGELRGPGHQASLSLRTAG